MYRQIKSSSAEQRLTSSPESRVLAWSLLLGLSQQSIMYELYDMYLKDAFDLTKSSMRDVEN